MPSDYDFCHFCRQINARSAARCIDCGRLLPWATADSDLQTMASNLAEENQDIGEIQAYAPGMNSPDPVEPSKPPISREEPPDEFLDGAAKPPRRRVPVLLGLGLALVVTGLAGLEFFGAPADDGRVNLAGAAAGSALPQPKPVLGPVVKRRVDLPWPQVDNGSSVQGVPVTLDDEVSVAAGPAFFDIPDLIQDDIDGVRLALGSSSSDGPEQPAPSQGADAFFQSWTRRGETLHVLYRMPSTQVVAVYFTSAHPWPASGMQRIIAAQRLDVGDPAYTITLTHDKEDRKLCVGFLVKTR